MSNVPLPRPGPLGLIQYAGVDMLQYAGAVSAAKDAEIAALRADFAALQRAIVGDTGASAILEAGRLRAEVAGLREDHDALLQFAKHVRRYGDTGIASMAIAVLAARKGEATTPPPSPSPRS